MSDIEKFACFPPPPPPLPFQQKQTERKIENEFEKLTEEELNTALEKCVSAHEKHRGVFFVTNTYLKPQLQVGPMCGLVALSIASSTTNFTNVEEILQQAIALNYTKQGEIFEAGYLAALAEKCCSFKARLIEGGLNSHFCCILNSLLEKGLLLVPYDADHNHSPCCKKGYKAHWAVITGFAVLEIDNRQKNQTTSNNDAIIITSNSSICHRCRNNDKSPVNFDVGGGKITLKKKSIEGIKNQECFNEGEIYLIGMQGKSKHFGVWAFDDLVKSNDNLVCFSPNRDAEDYIVPDSVAEGLKGKAIILQPSTGA